MRRASRWLHESSLANAATVVGMFGGFGTAAISFGLLLWAGKHYWLGSFLFALGGAFVAIGIAWFVLALLFPYSPEGEMASQHAQDIRTFAAGIRKKQFPSCLKDWEASAKLLRSALRSHVPELAELEDQLRQWQDRRLQLWESMRSRAKREATSLFGPDELKVGTQLMSAEAEGTGRSGQAYFGDSRILEIRSDGNLWFGAYDLGKWHLERHNADLVLIRRDLMEILRAVDDWEEVHAFQQLPDMTPTARQYDELLARISLSTSLSGTCDLCSGS